MSKRVAREPKVFYVYRLEDVSGVSGIGMVAEGTRFTNGKVAITWRGEVASVTVYDRLADALRIHTHGDKTRFYWAENCSWYNPETGDWDDTPRPDLRRFITYTEIYEPGEFVPEAASFRGETAVEPGAESGTNLKPGQHRPAATNEAEVEAEE
jgi:hypothetical protein